MKKSDRLRPVKMLAENKVKDAAMHMARSSKAYEESLQQLAKLTHYREEYMTQFKAKGEKGIPAARLVEYQAFVHKIDQAIEMQKQNVEKARHDVGHKQASFQAKHNRKKAVDKVIEKSRTSENMATDSREQKEVDDRGQRGIRND